MTTAVTISMSAADWALVLRSVRRDAACQRMLGWEDAAVIAGQVGDRLDATIGAASDPGPTEGAGSVSMGSAVRESVPPERSST